MQTLLDDWKLKTAKLGELQAWLTQAGKEIKGAAKTDPRWTTFNEVEAAAQRLEKELENIETDQEEALTRHLEAVGPITLELEGGDRRVISARVQTAGGNADLLPAELLNIWRVAAVFQGSVVGNERLTFGDAEQIAKFKPEKKRR